VARAREVLGTLATLTAVAPDERTAAAAVEAGYARLADVNRLMSDYLAESEIGRVNAAPAGTPVPVAPETLLCVQHARAFGAASGGAFDITCRPLVALWKQAGRQQRLPTPEELAATRALVGCDRIVVDAAASTLALPQPGMQLDLGGIAKGYALDLAAAAMRAAGAESVLVDVGGDVVALGTTPEGKPWRVGVRHPFQDGLIAELLLRDGAVATSGVQQRFYEIGGHRYSHIIDPRTGWPAEQASSVTVIAADGITADAWATAFCVLTVAEGQQLIAAGRAPGVEVLWLTGTAAAPVQTQTAGFAPYRAPP
jgi:thiamine biosynthesis lipoprotein